MGAERAVESATQTRSVTVDPPVAGGAAAPVGAAGAAPAAGAAAAAPAFDPAPLVTAVDGNDGAGALRIASGAPRDAIAALTTGAKLDAFYTAITAVPLGPVSRRQLNTLYAGVDLANKLRVFGVRFRVTVSGSGATFTETELDIIYNQAVLLPPTHAEGLANFQALRRVAAGPATHSGSRVDMNALPTDGTAAEQAAEYSSTFRHEMGHAIDDAIGAPCATLRNTTAGWTRYDTTDALITAAGGYGTIPAALQPVVRTALDNYRGPGSTFNAPTSTFDATLQAAVMAAHPEVTATQSDGSDAVSQDMATLNGLNTTNLLLKVGTGSQGNNNYWRYTAWPGDGAKHFFINHWYAAGFSIAKSTFDDLVAWGNVKAAFSDKEWFAEIYAEWYNGGAHRTFPAFVTTFMESHVARFGAPAAAQQNGATRGGGNPRVPS
jgi:hypothetical protein